MSNPWDVKPQLTTGDTSADPIYHAVGRALSVWEEVEMQVFGIFCSLCGIPGPGRTATAQAFGAIASSSARIDMTSEAAQEWRRIKPDKSIERIVDWIYHVKKSLPRRNEMAHGVVGLVGNSELTSYYLAPPQYAIRKTYNTLENATWERFGKFPVFSAKYAYTSSQIIEYGDYFRSLRDEAFSLTGLAFSKVARQTEENVLSGKFGYSG